MQALAVGDHLVRTIVAETEPGVTRVVFDLGVLADSTSSESMNPDRLMIELRPRGASQQRSSALYRTMMGGERIRMAAPLAIVPQPVPVKLSFSLVGPVPALFTSIQTQSATVRNRLEQ